MKCAKKIKTRKTLRGAIVALGCAFALTATSGCFSSPRATDTFAGAAMGAGAGSLIGGAEGSPGTGALIGGLGGGAVGYLVGTEMQNNGYYDNYYGPGYYRGGY